MMYQLPNGKVINITIEQFLELTDEDIQYLISIDYGNHVRSPWSGSAISKSRPSRQPEESHDNSIDFIPEEEDCHQQPFPSLDDMSPLSDDFPESPDTQDQD